jgi:hypothetical protein
MGFNSMFKGLISITVYGHALMHYKENPLYIADKNVLVEDLTV